MPNNKLQEIFTQWGLLIALLFATIIFGSKLGISALNPTEIGWLLTSNSDWTPDFVAWMYFREAPWSFPLGVMEGYSYPGQVSIGLTGAIPLLAIPFKVLDPILPEVFQFYGIWMLLCFVLQAYFAYKLLGVLKIKDKVIQSLGACFFVLSYSMLDRIGHLNLCAHWLILAGLYYYFSSIKIPKAVIAHSVLVAMSVWIHPYLILFTLSIGGAHFLKAWIVKDLSFIKMILYTLIPLLSAILAWVLVGNHILDSDQAVAEGFGIFSANLNTFFTPKIDTPITAAFPRYYVEQYEGVAYLGIGVLAFVFFIPVLLLFKKVVWKWKKEYLAISLVALGFFIFSLSHKVTFNQKLLFEIPLPQKALDLLGTFRASGRYVWILQYLFMSSFILFIDGLKLPKKWVYSLLVFTIVLNIVDFHDVIKRDIYIDKLFFPVENFEEELWGDIISSADKLTMYPSHANEYVNSSDDMVFSYVAGKFNKPINTGHLARYDSNLRDKHRDSLTRILQGNGIDLGLSLDFYTNHTFITNRKSLLDLDLLYAAQNHVIFELNEYFTFIPKTNTNLITKLKETSRQDTVRVHKEQFGAFAQRNKNNFLLMAVMDEASSYLNHCDEIVSFLESKNSQLLSLTYRESYVGFFDESPTVVDKRGKKNNDQKPSPVTIDTTLQFILEGQHIEKEIKIYSAGKENDNEARIFVEGVDYSKNNRGLNIVVLDRSGQVIESTSFDTYMMCHHFTDKSSLTYKVWKIE